MRQLWLKRVVPPLLPLGLWHESSHLCPLLPPFVLLPLLLRVIRERDLGKKGEKGVEEA